MVFSFSKFWEETGEPSIDDLVGSCAEYYRLIIEHSYYHYNKIIRMQRPTCTQEKSRLIVHCCMYGSPSTSKSKSTHEIWLDEVHWKAMDSLLNASDFWEIGEDLRGGFDGGKYTVEAWKNERFHQVTRWSPNAVIPGGELFSIVTDFLQRLAELAEFECSDDLQDRYHGHNKYIPKRRISSQELNETPDP